MRKTLPRSGRGYLSRCLTFLVASALVSPTLLADDLTADAQADSLSRTGLDLSGLTELSRSHLAQDEAGGGESFTDGLTLSGFIDTAYSYNFSNPKSPVQGRTNAGRIFDTRHSSFDLHAAQLILDREATEGMPIGVEIKLTAGQDASGLHAAGLTDGDIDITAANFSILIPGDVPGISGGSLKIGKWETTIGYEVIPSGDNDQYSRSFLFGLAIPFTHTGVLFSNEVDAGGMPFSYNAGIVNGWDNVTDNNSMKSFMGGFGITPCDEFSLSMNGIIGPEAGNDADYQGVLDIVANVNLADIGLNFGANFDYGASEVDTAAARYQKWYGIAGYAKYDLGQLETDCLNNCFVAFRSEVFWDPDGFRLGLVDGGGNISSRYFEFTTTLGWRPWENLLVRLEHRYDLATEEVFADGNDDFDQRYQNTIAINSVLTF